jgi:hypothetical protein
MNKVVKGRTTWFFVLGLGLLFLVSAIGYRISQRPAKMVSDTRTPDEEKVFMESLNDIGKQYELDTIKWKAFLSCTFLKMELSWKPSEMMEQGFIQKTETRDSLNKWAAECMEETCSTHFYLTRYALVSGIRHASYRTIINSPIVLQIGVELVQRCMPILIL